MATLSMQVSPQAVMRYISKLNDADPDFRFMSLNDLLQTLERSKSDFLHHDFNVGARAAEGIINALDDQNGEVQNLAIRCLGPLVTRIHPAAVSPMIQKLSDLKLKNSVDTAIPSLALRAVITALPRPIPGIAPTKEVEAAYGDVSRVLIPRLVGPGPKTKVPNTHVALPSVPEGMLQNEDDLNAESVDVLIEVVRCFGPMLDTNEVESMHEVVFKVLQSEKGTSVVKKRAVAAISMLAVYLSNEHLTSVVSQLNTALQESNISPVTRRLYISILGSMARSIPTGFGPHTSATMPSILLALSEDELEYHIERLSDGDDLGQDFNDVREAALVSLEAFLASCPRESSQFTDDTIAACLRYLKYDPNYAMNDDEEEDEEMDEDEDKDEDEDFDADNGLDDDDDDDASWKVRRCAAKTLYTFVATRGSGDLLENGVLYSKAAPSLIKRIEEREENVRLEVISTLSLLVRKTGEGLRPVDSPLDVEPDVLRQTFIRRKRRRQSSATAASQLLTVQSLTSVEEKVPQSGPRADLARLTPAIVKASLKQLKGRSVATKQAIVNLLDDIVLTQRGGLSEFFPNMIGSITEAIMSTASRVGSTSLGGTGSSASATPSTLRIAALRLLSDILKTHSSSHLDPYLTKISSTVAEAVHDRYYKISSEAVQTVQELVKTMTPPRSHTSGNKLAGELQKLYEVIMDRASANDADVEVRQRAIHALGVLLSRTSDSQGSSLVSTGRRFTALNMLQERLKNETTRRAAVRAIDSVSAFVQTPDQLEKPWMQEVALELSAQLRKANRALRGSSIVALKHLITSPAAKGRLEQPTVEGVIAALVPVITNADTHLLGHALIILASLLPEHAKLVAAPDMINALCELLKSHSAAIVLDQLILLVGNMGQSGAGEPLMHGLLRKVSISGDPSVVGKLIGTLLVTGGTSAGVSLKSFVQELRNSSESGDEARVCLALAVLGEAGKKMGTDSPLEPSLFLSQFHGEPDKVSLASAISLGRAGSGDIAKFLPIILKKMNEGGNIQYLLIQSVKEVLESVTSEFSELASYSPAIWDQLLAAADVADNKIVCAECIGRLAILDPKTFMPRLQKLLEAESSGVRGVAVQAVRYTLPESDAAFDAMLQTMLVNMLLTALQDDDIEIRRLAMTTLNSAAHNKPTLIHPRLGDLVPFVLKESVIKPELVREVQMGPFKHQVDDGLEARKSAYETLYALMETAFGRISNIQFYDRVIAGLKDDNDIRQLCNIMITKLIVIDPDETARRLDSIAEAYRSALSVKLKDSAVKQEYEKQEEGNKSVLRVTLLLGDKMKAMTGNASAASTNAGAVGIWASYWEWVNKDFEKPLKALKEENREFHMRMV